MSESFFKRTRKKEALNFLFRSFFLMHFCAIDRISWNFALYGTDNKPSEHVHENIHSYTLTHTIVVEDEGRDKYVPIKVYEQKKTTKNAFLSICLCGVFIPFLCVMYGFLVKNCTHSGRYKLQRNCNKPTVFIVMQELFSSSVILLNGDIRQFFDGLLRFNGEIFFNNLLCI